MKHIVSLSPQLELIYVEAAKVLNIQVDEILCSVLEDYVENLIMQKKKVMITGERRWFFSAAAPYVLLLRCTQRKKAQKAYIY